MHNLTSCYVYIYIYRHLNYIHLSIECYKSLRTDLIKIISYSQSNIIIPQEARAMEMELYIIISALITIGSFSEACKYTERETETHTHTCTLIMQSLYVHCSLYR